MLLPVTKPIFKKFNNKNTKGILKELYYMLHSILLYHIAMFPITLHFLKAGEAQC